MPNAIEELREALDDPRWTQELYLIGRALVELADKFDRHIHDTPSKYVTGGPRV